MTPVRQSVRTVLFDLDGTLADTAPDLAFALNRVLEEQNRAPLPFEQIRPVVSHGGMALIRLGFGLSPDAPQFEPLRQRLLEIYRANIARGTTLFPGTDTLLEALEAMGMSWGVVTNKPAWLTEPLLEALGVLNRAVAVVSGDTLPERKPHPAPLLLACEQAGSLPGECIYLGDAERDMEAARRAGMPAFVVNYGYIGEDDRPTEWGAEGFIDHPMELLPLLERIAAGEGGGSSTTGRELRGARGGIQGRVSLRDD